MDLLSEAKAEVVEIVEDLTEEEDIAAIKVSVLLGIHKICCLNLRKLLTFSIFCSNQIINLFYVLQIVEIYFFIVIC